MNNKNPFAYQQRLDRQRELNDNKKNIKCSIPNCPNKMSGIIDEKPYCSICHEKLMKRVNLSRKDRPK